MAQLDREQWAERAVSAYQTMQRRFRKGNGMYRYDEGPPIRTTAQLWPFGRVLMATLDLAGIDESAPGGLDITQLISEHLQALEQYWDPAGPRPAYCSDVSGASRRGDRYYDDNAWVGLALIEAERLRPGSVPPERAQDLFQFAASGWAPEGGVFWVEQGRGTGMRNRDRNTVSNAPNAEIGLHLADLGRPQDGAGSVGPKDMYQWVLDNLDASHGTDSPATGLFWDKIRGDGTIDRAIWSYNQGSMVGANVLLARTESSQQDLYLGRAEAIARKALREFASAYERGSPAFLAIFFRNLLLLHQATSDDGLRSDVMAAMTQFGEIAWSRAQQGRRGILGLGGGGGPKLLEQASYVQVLALLAWKPESYGRLA